MCPLVLGKIVTAGELLATLLAFEWFVLSVERAIMTLQVFLTAETTVAEMADECLGWVLSQRLLAATAVDVPTGAIVGGIVHRALLVVSVIGRPSVTSLVLSRTALG